jgi:hypothetical protein
MGHYDNCRDGYCPSCGAAPGNIVNGRCEFCHPPKYIDYDTHGTLADWLMFVLFLIEENGEDAVLTLDAGYNNVSLVVT